MGSLLNGERLEIRCSELGIDIEGAEKTLSSSGRSVRASDHELQHRLIEVERSIRESRLWLIAVISSVASVCSALAAIIAVATK